MDESNVKELITLWEERMKEKDRFDPSYCDALRDCIFELKQLSGVSNQEDEEYRNPVPWMWF